MSDAIGELLAVWDAGEANEGEHDLDRLSRAIEKLRGVELSETSEYSAELVSRGRRTGIIWAVRDELPIGLAVELQRQLQERFPNVVCAVGPGPGPLAFEWDEPDEDES